MYSLEQKVSILEMQKSSYLMELEMLRKDLTDMRKKIKVLEKCIAEMPKYTSKLGYRYNLQKDIWENDKLKWLATFQLSEFLCEEFAKNL